MAETAKEHLTALLRKIITAPEAEELTAALEDFVAACVKTDVDDELHDKKPRGRKKL